MSDLLPEKACPKPCATCPWLKANHGKPNPPGYDPRSLTAQSKTDDFHDWYSKANARRLWGGLRKGEVMVCHATDPNAASYGGKTSNNAKPRLCVGAVLLVLRHAKVLEACGSFKEYRDKAGHLPMTKRGFARWIELLLFGQAPRECENADVGLPFESVANDHPK